MKITVLYDNIPADQRLQTGWGFSALLEHPGNNILFDTGADGPALLSNMGKLGIDPMDINAVVISHKHPDHTGGLKSVLGKNPGCRVFLPESNSSEICSGIWTTAATGWPIREQALVATSGKGLVVLAGCSHPGIVKIVDQAKERSSAPVYLLAGGFHLEYMPSFIIGYITKALKRSGVIKIAPSHCTGEKALKLLKRAWGPDLVGLGCGAGFKIP